MGWYRKHFNPPDYLLPSANNPAPSFWIDIDGAQTSSTVWLNGQYLGSHASGYTPSRYWLNASQLIFGKDNLLAVKVDATKPDGWWYDGETPICS